MNGIVLPAAGLLLALGAAGAELAPLGSAQVGFRMHLGVVKDKGVDVTPEDMASLAVTTNGAVVEAMWRGHPRFGADFTATATFTRQGEGWEYAFSWRNLDERKLMVERVSFPDLVAPRTARSGVLYSRRHGMGMVRRPDWGRLADDRPFLDTGLSEFQFTALIDEEIGGWYVDARDPRARCKNSYAACRPAPGGARARIGITAHMPATRAGTAAGSLPWKGRVAPFRGGWWQAAQLYKPWALEQSWAAAARARKSRADFQKLRDVCFWAWNRGGCDAVAKPLLKFAADSGVKCALHWDWWHRYPKDVGYPTYWPPYEGVEKFTRTVAELKRAGCYTMVYVNGRSRDRDDASWNAAAEAECRMEHDGRIHGTHWNRHMADIHRLVAVCGEAPAFQRAIGGVVAHLREAGLDAVYLDQVSCGAALPCWNPGHRHAPGDVLGPLEGYHRFLRRLRADNPGLHLGSEEVSEAFLEDCDLFISLFGTSYERCGLGAMPEFEAVPVWNALYHGLSAVFGTYLLIDGIPPWDDARWPAENKWTAEQERDWPALFPDQFAVEFARTLAWGNQPSVHAMSMEHATSARFAAEYRFMVEAARFYREHREFLFDGELLDPGSLLCAKKEVKFQRRGIYHLAGKYEETVQPALPTVFHNVWRAPDGRTAAILVNWSREPQAYALDCPAGRAKGVAPPLFCLAVEMGR